MVVTDECSVVVADDVAEVRQLLEDALTLAGHFSVIGTAADARAVRMLLSLLGGGLPLEELMQVADIQLETIDRVAAGAVELFLRYVREPLLASRVGQKEEAERMVAAFRLMLNAATGLIAYSFQRTALNLLEAELEAHGNRSERAALRREVDRRHLQQRSA